MKANLISHLIRIDDKEKLARIWCDFNRWNWPEDIPETFKPQWWDGVSHLTHKDIMNRQQGLVSVIMDYVESKTTKKLIDKSWMMGRNEVDRD